MNRYFEEQLRKVSSDKQKLIYAIECTHAINEDSGVLPRTHYDMHLIEQNQLSDLNSLEFVGYSPKLEYVPIFRIKGE